MTHSIIVNKNGDLTEKKIKNFDKKYTCCNYKTDKDFILLHTYKNINETYKHLEIEIYGKKKEEQIMKINMNLLDLSIMNYILELYYC